MVTITKHFMRSTYEPPKGEEPVEITLENGKVVRQLRTLSLAEILEQAHARAQAPHVPDQQEYTIVEGYEKDGVTHLIDSNSTIWAIQDDAMVWSGKPVALFRQRLDAASGGDIVRYRNKPMRKLTDAEVAAFDGQQFQDGGIGLR